MLRTPSLFAIVALALVAVPASAQRGQGQEAHAEARRNELPESVLRAERQTGGEVLRAEPMQRDGREVYRLKVLTPDGRVRIMRDDPRERRREAWRDPRREAVRDPFAEPALVDDRAAMQSDDGALSRRHPPHSLDERREALRDIDIPRDAPPSPADLDVPETLPPDEFDEPEIPSLDEVDIDEALSPVEYGDRY